MSMAKKRASTGTVQLPVCHFRSSTHRILSLILTAAASLAFDALPPQSLDSRCELWGELETGRVACGKVYKHRQTSVSPTHSFLWMLTGSSDPLASLQKEKKKLPLELKALTESNLAAKCSNINDNLSELCLGSVWSAARKRFFSGTETHTTQSLPCIH